MTIPLHKWIQTYPNFPKPGILFYDIAPILENPAFLKQTVETLAAHIDECVAVADLEPLADLYQRLLNTLLIDEAD